MWESEYSLEKLRIINGFNPTKMPKKIKRYREYEKDFFGNPECEVRCCTQDMLDDLASHIEELYKLIEKK